MVHETTMAAVSIIIPVFKKIGGFNEDFSIHFYDKDISLRLMNYPAAEHRGILLIKGWIL